MPLEETEKETEEVEEKEDANGGASDGKTSGIGRLDGETDRV